MSHIAMVGTVFLVMLGVTGIWIIATSLIPQTSEFMQRVALQVSDLSDEAAEVTERLKKPPLHSIMTQISQVLGFDRFNRLGIAKLQAQLGVTVNPGTFLSNQLLSALAGVAAIFALTLVSEPLRQQHPVIQVLLAIFGAVVGWMIPIVTLSQQLKHRQRRIALELPTVLEFLTLSLAAGESIAEGMRRISVLGQGVLVSEFQRITALHSSGMSLKAALEHSAESIGQSDYSRFIQQLTAAMDRGNPLVSILRAQSEDSIEKRRKQLIEDAGKKEIAMMVPLVFLILPVVVLFAMYPGLLALRLGS